MIITCEACNTSFNLDDKVIKPTGSKVRCSVCANVFTVFPPRAPATGPEPLPVEPEPVPRETDSVPEPPETAVQEERPTTEDASFEAIPEEDVLKEDAGDLFADGTDFDFALDEEPEESAPAPEIEDAVSDALEKDLEDFSFGDETEAVGEGEDTVIASLDDDDFNFDLSPESEDEDETATMIVNLDDDELDLSASGGESDVAETVISDLDQEDFDLEMSSEPESDDEGTATVIANLDDETLDIDEDFSLEPEDAGGAETVARDDGGPQTLDDLDDLSLTLNIDLEEEEAAKPAQPVEEAADAYLDELSLDLDLEEEDESTKGPAAVDAEKALDDELDLQLDMEEEVAPEKEPEAEPSPLEDDLDLSALESLLDEDDADDTVVVEDVEDLELSLDEGDFAPETDAGTADEADKADKADELLEDLEFDLDGEGPAETAGVEEAQDADSEIDLSEIEKMLEEPEDTESKFTSTPDQDLELDIEASLGSEKWMSESGEEDQLVADEELDLSDLEQALEDVEEEAPDTAPEDAELELELDLEDSQAADAAPQTAAVDSELEFDLSDFEETPQPEAGARKVEQAGADMELEFEIEEEVGSGQRPEDEGLEETIAVAEPEAKPAETPPPESVAAPAAPPKPKKTKPPKKGVSKSLVFLLVIVILGGIGYGAYYALNKSGIEIPFLSDYLKPKVDDPGNLKLTTYDISSKFIDNTSAGKLFVVSGKVKNGYSENRGMITLAGKIFSTGKVVVNQERVYCGNIMSDLELANLEWDKIKSRLSNRLGDNRSNVKVEPGQSIPFMVVFSNLPQNMEEFTIEVTGSTSLK
jgi:predicted Zn finger-like uncharacterized protein